MKKEEIHLDDISRILFGQSSPSFLFEVLVRTLIIFIVALVFIKWLGKRMSGQITIMEMTIMIMIGAMISVPMQFYERGLLEGFILLLATLIIYNTINWLGFKNRKFENFLQGKAVMLVKDNTLCLDELKSSRISRQQLFAVLRNEEIFNLGQVKRLYLEACGKFSVYREDTPKPGLFLFPPDDSSVLPLKKQTVVTMWACCNCGTVKENHGTPCTCENCESTKWMEAGKADAS